MKYMGSKSKIAKEILPIILKNRRPGQYYVEPFCGGCNVIDKVTGPKIAGDNNTYLIAMWKYILNNNYLPQQISREEYNSARDIYMGRKLSNIPMGLIGYIGFCGSYSGRFFEGGYAGITKTKTGQERNYSLEAYNNIIKQKEKLRDVLFYKCDYTKLIIPPNSIIYCDPPYNHTKQYSTSKGFNYEQFWDWCREKQIEGHNVYISEYDAPKDFKCVWEKPTVSSLRANGVIRGAKQSVERLFIFDNNKGTI